SKRGEMKINFSKPKEVTFDLEKDEVTIDGDTWKTGQRLEKYIYVSNIQTAIKMSKATIWIAIFTFITALSSIANFILNLK
ncbi:MAG: hypothetical protein JW737_10240, partial [Acidobacteria bacterium]|nr:hypothetical protein [Acidobacteriota bacterium]